MKIRGDNGFGSWGGQPKADGLIAATPDPALTGARAGSGTRAGATLR